MVDAARNEVYTTNLFGNCSWVVRSKNRIVITAVIICTFLNNLMFDLEVSMWEEPMRYSRFELNSPEIVLGLEEGRKLSEAGTHWIYKSRWKPHSDNVVIAISSHVNFRYGIFGVGVFQEM